MNLYDLIQDQDVKQEIQSYFQPPIQEPHIETDDLNVVKKDVETLGFRKFPALIAQYAMARKFWTDIKNRREESIKFLEGKLEIYLREEAIKLSIKVTDAIMKAQIQSHEALFSFRMSALEAKEYATLYGLIEDEYQHGFNALTEEQRKENAQLKSGVLEAQ